jgi:hypothetical protein
MTKHWETKWAICFLYCLCQILLLASCTFYRVSNSIALLVHRTLLYNIVLLLIKMSVFFY